MGTGRSARSAGARRARLVLVAVVVAVVYLGTRGNVGTRADVGHGVGYDDVRERMIEDARGDMADATERFGDLRRPSSIERATFTTTVPRAPRAPPEIDEVASALYHARIQQYKSMGLDGLGGRTAETARRNRESGMLLNGGTLKRRTPLPDGKIAFLFLTNRVMPLHEAWSVFFAGADADRFTVYVNADPESPPQLGVFAGREIQNSVRTEWGTFSIVKATIALLRAAIRDDLSNERFVLVSDNAVPLAPFHATACALLAEPRSVINACDLTKHDRDARSTVNHDHLIRLPPDFPSWINGSVWRKSSQWWVLNRRHAAMVSTGALSMRARDEFAKKCVAQRRPRETPVEDLDARSCYGDEHYFATVLALHGEDYATTCSEGVTYVNWEAYASGHPKTFASVGAFAREREKRPRVELLSCGGRLDPPTGSEVFEALETTTCADAGDFENDVVRRARLDPEEETPRFGKCLFARKFADDASRDFTREWGNAIGT